MKKIIALAIASLVVAGVATPSFAATSGPNCVFKDKSLCVTESLSPTTDYNS
ncbi:hypothetical protein DevBK_03210 [Devosia sp. BK]|uniref:hypothetical protein n=1 Tax=unclassified Devosia TaxID=196773 RepID=UPI000A4AE0E3|nr:MULTISPECIES: hypothetical protein [unclassified Devosia]MDV3250337.1 hypothetical protein [Devosia sp. BK]